MIETPLRPASAFFPPSELMEYVAERLRVKPYEIPANYNTIGAKGVTDCNFRCGAKSPTEEQPAKKEGYACYMYVDDEWKQLPPVMTEDVARLTTRRMAEYARARGARHFNWVMHGGEPLNIHDPVSYYDKLVDVIRQTAEEFNPGMELHISMVTNASLITPEIVEMFKRHNIRVTCSLDGDEESHNRNRVTKMHQIGTFKMVARGIRTLLELAPELCNGLLATMDLRNPPLAVYEALCSYGVDAIDLLIPYATHDDPPPMPEGAGPTPYADWLLTIFHQWIKDKQAGKRVPTIRLFQSICDLSRGLPSGTEAIGPYTNRIAFVETGGKFTNTDSFRAISPEAVAAPVHVGQQDSFARLEKFARANQQLGRKSVATACADCKLLDICGGGHLENRFSAARGFDNPSVYCEDLKKLIKEIVSTMNAIYRDDAALEVRSQRSNRPCNAGVKKPPVYSSPQLPPSRSLATRIRPATLDDIDSIVATQAEEFLAHHGGINGIPAKTLATYVHDEFIPQKTRYWLDVLQNRRWSDKAIVAELGNKLLGAASVVMGANLKLSTHTVSPQAAGYGVEEELLREVNAYAPDSQLWTMVTLETPKLDFFRRVGFMAASHQIVDIPVDRFVLTQIPLIRKALAFAA